MGCSDLLTGPHEQGIGVIGGHGVLGISARPYAPYFTSIARSRG
jgi:hypothetical protein